MEIKITWMDALRRVGGKSMYYLKEEKKHAFKDMGEYTLILVIVKDSHLVYPKICIITNLWKFVLNKSVIEVATE